jgi:amino acid adenylation domain-containing protein
MVRQYNLPAAATGFHLVYEDLRDVNGQDKKIASLVRQEAVRPFDLVEGPLVRAGLFTTTDDEWVLTVTVHHIISDAWSVKVFISELLRYYKSFCADGRYMPAPLKVQYKDYAEWQQAQLATDAFDIQKTYWLRQFEEGLPDPCIIPDKIRPAVKTYKGEGISLRLNNNLYKAFKQFNRENNISSFISLATLLKLLLYKYSGQEDIVIGTTVTGREHIDLEDQVGFYINTLALRTKFDATGNCSDMISRVKETVLNGYANQAYPFDELVHALNLQRDMSRNPLFDVLLEWQEGNMQESIAAENLQDISVRPYDGQPAIPSKFDLRFVFTEAQDGMGLFIEFCTDVFNRSTIEQMAVHLECLLENIVTGTDKPVYLLDYMREKERNTVLYSFNKTEVAFPAAENIITLFDKQVAANAALTAVTFKQTSLSYAALAEQSERLASSLSVKYGVSKGDRVGILLDRSEKMIIAVLGVLRAGATYVPVDPSYPSSRQEYIVKDAGINVLVTQTDYLFDLTWFTGTLFAIDLQLEEAGEFDRLPAIHLQPTDPAYVIYTSGSTGKPKGCMIPHGSFANYIQWANSYYFNAKADAGFGLFTSLSFDLTITSIFCALTKGAELYVYDQQEELSSVLAHAFGPQSRQNSIKLTPSHINMLKHLDIDSSAMACAVVGGEELTMEQVSVLKKINPQIEIYNEYGPTEATVGCVVKKVEEHTPVLIGRPIANATIYILDKYLQACALNVPGEICIGGSGLAVGYLNRPELTAEKFVQHPFREGERIYRTGDLGKWLDNGELCFLGRRDEQVKIKGYRIETGEVEKTILGYASINEAVVNVRVNRQNDKELVAYYVGGEKISDEELRSYLSGILPAYMVPSAFMQLDAIPLTVNGKIDRSKLPDPRGEGDTNGPVYAPPRNTVEEEMVKIWQEVLDKEQIGIRHPFFESGGDSIKVLRMISEVRKRTGISIPVAEMYKYTSIESMSAFLAANKTSIEDRDRVIKEAETIVMAEVDELRNRVMNELPAADAARIEDIYPMSDIEKGMIFESAVNADVSVYHDQKIYARSFLNFDPELFRQALQLVTEKHTILRSSFDIENYSTEIKLVRKNVAVPYYYEDISRLPREEQAEEVNRYMEAERKRPFDFTVAPLWRMSVFSLGADEYAFLLQCHHAILDGWSETSLVAELNNVYLELREYPGYKPPALKSGYKDFIIQHLADKKDESIRNFWKMELADCARLNLFEEGEEYAYHLVNTGSDHLRALEMFAVTNGTSVKVVSLSAYLYMLKVLNYDDEIVTGLVTHNRPQCEEADKILGCFLNTIPLRMMTDDACTAAVWVKQVHDKLIDLKDNERLSMMDISLLHNRHQQTGNPFFDVLFNHIDFYVIGSVQTGQAENEAGLKEAAIPVNSYVRGNTFFDFSVSTTGGSYSVSLNLRKKLRCGFSPARVIELYLTILNAIIKEPRLPLSELSCMNENDREKVFTVFNDVQETYPTYRSVMEVIEENAARHPAKTAVVYNERALSYADLENNAASIAIYLRNNANATKDVLFGVMMDRSESMMVTVLGVWQAGSAYVPLDMNFPDDRIMQIIEASGMVALLVDSSVPEEQLARLALSIPVINVEQIDLTAMLNHVALPDVEKDLSALAYVIYTSGSTGQPKGVMIEHFGMINHIGAKITEMGIDADSRVAQNATHTFDISVWQLFAGPVAGGTTVIYDQDTVAEPVSFTRQIAGDNITILETVPSYFVEMLSVLEEGQVENQFAHLKILILNAETLMHSMVKRWLTLQPGIPIVNTYGATEASDDISHYIMNNCPETATVPVLKKPIQHFEVYIVNKHLKPVPPGITGEILLAGPAVGRGYLNDPVKTAQAFLTGPLNGLTRQQRIYRTGDLGRFLSDGTMEFLGRQDSQVKIRGYRIELGEIEQTLTAAEGIENAVLIADTEHQLLIAYYQSAEELSKDTIRDFLRKKLPEYMLPQYYIWMAAFPLTPNGKINKRALPAPDISSLQPAYIAPANETEEKLSHIWMEVLNREKAGRSDNFFDLGGHSLKITRLAAQVHRVFNVKLPLRKLFATPVLEDQALLILSAQENLFTAIPPAPVQENYPLSASQRRMWVLSQFEESNTAYNMPGIFILKGVLDAEAFSHALQLLTARHESLRTVFRQDDTGEIRQYILTQDKTDIHPVYTDLRNEKDPEAAINQLARLQFGTSFNLAEGPLWRINIYQVRDNRWVLVYVIHHIISDGWSMGILFNELMIAYETCCQNKPLSLPVLRIQYKDYAAWEQQQLTGERMNADRQYWLSQFQGPLPVLELPGDYPRPAVKTFNGSVVTGKMDSELTAALTQFTRERDATLFMGLLAAVNVLLHRYTGQQDIIVGSPVAGREHADLANQIGLYVNTVALRARLNEEQSFTELLEQIKQNTIGAYEHQQYPFDELVNDLHLPRDTSRNALFEVMVVLQNAGADMPPAAQPESLEVGPYTGTAAAMSKFDLVFNFTESAGAIYLHTEYNSDIYAKNTIERLVAHLQQLLRSALLAPDRPVSAIDYLSPLEKDLLLNGFNDTAVSYPSPTTVVALFEEQVNAVPDNIALICNGKIFTYNELNENANRLAAYLRKTYRVKPGDLVVICLERGQQMATAILGILKSGAAYVPADPEYPAGRIQYMVEDSRCKVVIDTAELERFYEVQHKYSGKNPKRVNQNSDPAYVVYTSGSTGQPKGVIVEHRSLINLCYWHNRHFSVDRNDRATLYAGVGFDAAVWEFFPYLLNGAALYTVPADIRLNMDEMAAFYRNNKITISFLPTQVAEQFMATGNNNLRYLLTGGDKLVSFTLVNYTVVNNYGPSENTVVATSFTIQQHQHNIPVGKPVHNNQVYILDSRQQLCPLGVTGEICISGDSLARGYWNRPGLTDEKFVHNPFKKGAKMYKTGDLGRWLPDGNIEFAGRKDEQVKIRGHRVEPGEVENALLTCPGIISAVVIACKKEDGQNELAAYLASDETPDPAFIREQLAGQLPAYMIPTRFISLQAMPLTPNGKIDKKQLPDPLQSGVTATARYTAPRNSTEEKILNCWKKILGMQKISVYDNFFELGGHSLTITHLAGHIYKEFGIKVSFPELFTAETVEQQAALVQQKTINRFIAIPSAANQPHYPLSSAQHLFWLVSQFEEGNIAYNIPGVMQLEGELDTAVFSRAYHLLVQRHESLRTVFRKITDGTVRQFILQADEPGFAIHLQDFSTGNANQESLFTFIQEEISRPFDLAKGPLIRSFLVKTGDKKWVFCYIIHHIVGDGWSMHILSNELCTLYNACKAGKANPLAPLRIQYKDYAVWQLDQLNGKDLLKQKAYWMKQLDGELPVLELKYDRPRPVVKTYNGDVVLKIIEPPVADKFEKLLRKRGATLFMGLLSAVNALLHRYSGQTDIIIGTSVAGREHADLSDQVGYYLNTLALRTRFNGHEDFNGLLDNVKKMTLDAFENQQYPFEELVNSLNLQRDISRNNLFDVFVVMGDSDYHIQQPVQLDGVKVKGVPEAAQEASKFDLTFNFTETGEGIRLYAEYNTDLFNRSTIETTCNQFEAVLQSITDNPCAAISSLNYLSMDEQLKLLEEHNQPNTELQGGKTIPELIRDKVMRSPDMQVFPDTSFSYQQLDALSAQLAGYLTQQYADIQDRVTVIQLHNRQMKAAAMLAMQKCGGTYLLAGSKDYTIMPGTKLLFDDKGMDHFTATARQYPENFTPVLYKKGQVAMILPVSSEKDKLTVVQVKYGSLLNYLHWNAALSTGEEDAPVVPSPDETAETLYNKLSSYLSNPLVTGTPVQQAFSAGISADF